MSLSLVQQALDLLKNIAEDTRAIREYLKPNAKTVEVEPVEVDPVPAGEALPAVEAEPVKLSKADEILARFKSRVGG